MRIAATYHPPPLLMRPMDERLDRLDLDLKDNLARYERRIPELESTVIRESKRARLWLVGAGCTLALGALGGPVGLALGALASTLPLALGLRSLARSSGARACIQAASEASRTCQGLRVELGEMRQKHDRGSVERLTERIPGTIGEEPEHVTIGNVRLKRRLEETC